MLTAFSRLIGFKQDDSNLSPQNRVVALQSQIQELEEGETALGISRSTNRRTVVAATIGAAGGGLTGYLLSSLIVTVATFAAPITAVAVGTATGAAVLAAGYRMWTGNSKRNNQKVVDKVNDLSKNLVESKIKALAKAKAGSTVDLVLNRVSKVEEETTNKDSEKKPVGLVKLDPPLVKELLSSLKAISKHKPPVKIKKIDLSSVSLTKRNMTNLLKAGLGRHETEQLILSNDKHSDDMINLLREYIVKRKTAFQNLNELDLSGNAINATCINGIADIVSHLRLKELSLADNLELSEKILDKTKGPLSSTLTNQKVRLVSLRKINLANTGLVEDQAIDIATFIKNAVFLEEIDIDRNEGFTLEVVEEEVKEKGAVKSISLKELVTEYDEHLSMEEVFAERDQVLKKIGTSKRANESWPLFLINYKLSHKSFPEDVAKYLESTVFNKAKIDGILEKIQAKRSEHLGVNDKCTVSITESELIACYEDELHNLYQKVKNKKGASLVDPKLVSQINESQVNQRSVELSVGKVPVPPRTKQSAVKTPRGKVAEPPREKQSEVKTPRGKEGMLPRTKQSEVKTPRGKVTPAKSQVPAAKTPFTVKLPNAPITTQFNSARTAKLHAEINEALGADVLARNPRLAVPTPRV
jgi:hypothetical protein